MEDNQHIVSEPVVELSGYATIPVLRNRLSQLVSNSNQAERLQKCIEILSEEDYPCTYSDDEFKEEIRMSEESGFVSDSYFVKSCKEKWGIEL